MNSSLFHHAITSYDVYHGQPGPLIEQSVGSGDNHNTHRWSNYFSLPGHNYRIVNMVRDPIDKIFSGYLYHRQLPPKSLQFDLCRAVRYPTLLNKVINTLSTQYISKYLSKSIPLNSNNSNTVITVETITAIMSRL